MYKVCAVVVTYNRKELLLRNVKSLLNQSVPLDVLIYDNASSDGTEEYLMEKGIIGRKEIIYKKGDKNSGGAGGFRFGAEIAYNRGYDFLWLMDDDGYCINNDTLSELIKSVNTDKKEIYNSYVTYDSNKLDPTFAINGASTKIEVMEKTENGVIKGGFPYNGTLIPRGCFKEVGFNDDRFFIYGDENDFYHRTKEHGYEWLVIINSLYYHPINRSIEKSWKVFGTQFEVKNQPIWKYYLEVRNTEINAIRHYHRSKHRLSGYLRVIITSLYTKDKKLKRMKYGFLGIKDAKKEYFGRPLMFDEK